MSEPGLLSLALRWLGAFAWIIATIGCDSDCPKGLVKINHRCQAFGRDAEVAMTEAGAAGDRSSRTRSVRSGVVMEGVGGGPSTAGVSSLAMDASVTRADAGGAVEPAEPVAAPKAEDVCTDASGGAVCDGAELHVCSDDGQTTSVESCADATLCEAGASLGRCALCDPGAHRCDGTRLDVCDESGLFTFQERCETAELCNADVGACTQMLCLPGEVSCSADRSTLNTCNADGSALDRMQSCGESGCDQQNLRCNQCRPGARSCEGDTLATCSNDGQTLRMMRCELAEDNGCGTASCEGSGCVYGHKAPGSACQGDRRCNANGACVACLEPDHCPAPDECHEAVCSRSGRCDTQPKPDGTSCGSDGTCRSGECDGSPKTVELKSFWHHDRGDNYTSGTTAGELDALSAGYTFVRVEGYAFETEQPGTVPLRLYWSREREDNFTTGTAGGEADARAASYTFVRVEGYVYETERPGTVPLRSYWNRERGDNFTTGTRAGEGDALGSGYVQVRVEGYALANPSP